MFSIRGTEVKEGPLRFKTPGIAIRLRWWLLWVFLSWLVRLPVVLARHPRTTGTVLAGLAAWKAWTVYGPWRIAGVVTGVVLLGAAWWWRWPESFAQRIVWRVRGGWRRVVVYRGLWQPTMSTLRLTSKLNDAVYVPQVVKVRSTGRVDLVTVRLLPGQILTDYAEVAERLAKTFGATDCRVRSHKRNRRQIVLWFLVDDPLTKVVPPIAPADSVDLKALTVALREDGLMYRLRLLGTHLLIAGATGAGKGSVLWSIIAALGPGIRSGLVQVWALDPKGGMELAAGRRLFAKFCYGGDDTIGWESAFAEVLDEAVERMRSRQATMRGFSRLHKPTVDEPFIVLVVDELASLTAYVTDRDLKRRIAAALSLLLSQGRAAGVTVVGALQDPRKEVLPFRDLFPTRLALRLAEAGQVGLVLAEGARARGARCDEIPESLPGVGYVGIDGEAEPVRVRFPFHSDDDVAELVELYSPDATGKDLEPSSLRPVEEVAA
ncbi:FtsK/SpoIIIE domain-containing protein [Micromonospora taraxaci]|uniref:FtsK/SpoIIIE domain-containing protein n=1 Tax=Micromonospora taraxaci TaxID=1316803 RepID=UPI0033C12D8A